MRSTGLYHVQINIRSENQSFYRDLFSYLGWTTIYDHPVVFAATGNNGASLWFESIAKDVQNDYDGPGVNHIAIGATTENDVQDLAVWLVERNVDLLFDTPRRRAEFSKPGFDYYQVMFESPDRVLFEFVFTGSRAFSE